MLVRGLWHHETKSVPLWLQCHANYAYIEKHPHAVYQRLKSSAELHRRSLNSEVIVCLESVLLPGKVSVAERLAQAREIRAQFAGQNFLPGEIDAAKRAGRP